MHGKYFNSLLNVNQNLCDPGSGPYSSNQEKIFGQFMTSGQI